MSTLDPDLGQLLAATIAATRGPMKTAIPAEVVAYDPARQAVTVKPTVSGRYQNPETGELIPFPLPTIANVPVAFPSADGHSIVWPLAVGDTVFLVCADRSLDEWKSTGLSENVPVDTRRFDLTDAVAIPGVRSFANPIPASGHHATDGVLRGSWRVGSSAAASEVVLEPPLQALLTEIMAWLAAHTHGDPASGVTTVPVQVADLPAPGSLGATKLKAE
jgi:hypothetical protein